MLRRLTLSSVRTRLVLLVAVVALPALLVPLVLVLVAYGHERAAVSEKLLNTARAAARVVDGQIENAFGILRTLAESRELRQGDLAGLQAYAERIVPGEDMWFTLSDTVGQQLINTRAAPGAPLPLTPWDSGTLAILERAGTHTSDLRTSRVTGESVVQISVRAGTAGGETRILSLVMRSAHVARALDPEKFNPGGVISLVDRTGRIIARNRTPEKFVGQLATPDMTAAVQRGFEGVTNSVTLENIPVLTAIGRAANGWSVLIGAPQAELYASARALLGWGLAGTALLVAAAVAVAWWIGRAMVRGVDVLSADAEAIRRGNMPPARSSGLQEMDSVGDALRLTAETLLRRTRTLEIVNRVNVSLIAEHDLERIVQSVTDAGREVSGAAFGAFFYNVEDRAGESYILYTLSGAPREAFDKLGMPRNTPIFSSTFSGEAVVRVDDILKDPRYGRMSPHHGMPPGHLPVRSYLAVPVKGRDGAVIGGLFFGHPQPGVFTAEGEETLVGLAGEAAIAIENAKLYRALETELASKSKTEADLRAAQAELQRHAQELEKTVEARTCSLRETAAQMEEFSYTISHDLRSPLRSMNSFASLLLEDYGPKLDEAGQDYLRRIVRATDRMQQMTGELLKYTRVARTQVVLGPTDVEAVVRATVEHYPQLQPPTDLRIVTPLARVQAFEPSLTQCLGNLLTNAAKFVREGEPARITVRTERRGDRVRIWIEDEGIGIPPEAQKTLFQVFHRLPTGRSYEGTGMGLAIVRKAVEKMGGTCGVESDGRPGSRFWIELLAA